MRKGLNMTSPASKPLQKSQSARQAAARVLKAAPQAEGSILYSIYGLAVGLVLGGTVLTYVYSNERTDIMFAVRHDGKLAPMQPMPEPNMSSEALINWVRMAVGEAFTYNFNDIVARLNTSQRFFTENGWSSFRSAFQRDGILSTVQSQRQFVTTLPSAATTIVEEEEVRGRYTWTIHMKTITSIYSGTSTVSSSAMSLKIERIDTKDSVSGYPFGIIRIGR